MIGLSQPCGKDCIREQGSTGAKDGLGMFWCVKYINALVSLRGKLAEAREELILAEVEVEVAVTTVEMYKMLSQSQ